MTNSSDLLNTKWYAVPNDLIGGWCVQTAMDPPSDGTAPMVGDFLSEAIARHVADLHNDWLAQGSPE